MIDSLNDTDGLGGMIMTFAWSRVFDVQYPILSVFYWVELEVELVEMAF